MQSPLLIARLGGEWLAIHCPFSTHPLHPSHIKGMILTALLAKGSPTAARVRSATFLGSSCFLAGSWWGAAAALMPLAPLLYRCVKDQ